MLLCLEERGSGDEVNYSSQKDDRQGGWGWELLLSLMVIATVASNRNTLSSPSNLTLFSKTSFFHLYFLH